jgi:hypothetical protein
MGCPPTDRGLVRLVRLERMVDAGVLMLLLLLMLLIVRAALGAMVRTGLMSGLARMAVLCRRADLNGPV